MFPLSPIRLLTFFIVLNTAYRLLLCMLSESPNMMETLWEQDIVESQLSPGGWE